ncbi:hypothetical protein EDB92DRAFT_1857011 [Lactarius akahatsu]|uniref:Uncharacterized protein n=1 Tax=Lactarius akahatsu TaxID=416441 RepID=A0AAD4LMM6_9AGAM|nr:hypothetical protein EDB92DRAFT_1857011 [Lactarius akahatsu]
MIRIRFIVVSMSPVLAASILYVVSWKASVGHRDRSCNRVLLAPGVYCLLVVVLTRLAGCASSDEGCGICGHWRYCDCDRSRSVRGT